MGSVFANGQGDRDAILGRDIPKTQKMVLDTSCLSLIIKKYISRVKWSNPGKKVAPSSTDSVVAIEKGAFVSPSTTDANFAYFYLLYR